MIKASVIKKNHIQFPEMIFGEDYNFSQKSFSILNVLVQHKMWFIANRYDDNISLVKSEKSTY